jgi:hypothetical protein
MNQWHRFQPGLSRSTRPDGRTLSSRAVSRCSPRQVGRMVARQSARQARPAGAPAGPDTAGRPGQRRNIPAVVNRD